MQALIDVGADVSLVVGHDGADSLEPVAYQHGIPFQRENKSPIAWNWPKNKPPLEWIVSVYFRYLVPEFLLKSTKGAVNIHGSLLPAYRGCSPINWAMAQGESRVGVTLHEMVAAADAGDIWEQVPVDIGPHQQAGEVMDILTEHAAEVLKRHFLKMQNGQIKRTPQPAGEFPLYKRRTHKDGIIDWSWPAERVHNLIRAVNPPERYGGAFTQSGEHVVASRLDNDTHEPGWVRFVCGDGLPIDVRMCPSCSICCALAVS